MYFGPRRNTPEQEQERLEKERLEQKQFIPCRVCGKDTKGSGLRGSKLCDNPKCFTTYYWEGMLPLAKADYMVRINRVSYKISPEDDSPDYCRGFGGRPFGIKLADGRKVLTTNLIHHGDIPEEFWDMLPDNAEWLPVAECNTSFYWEDVSAINERLFHEQPR